MALQDVIRDFNLKAGRIQTARISKNTGGCNASVDDQERQLLALRQSLPPSQRQEVDTTLRIRNQFHNCKAVERQPPSGPSPGVETST